ncbi:hypothetical protein L6452_40381 [Arctium lappa]|uniref:Uncharacterized protein n=1 Tax=Arctium lappa TaxID=4217 RepID=A0ACB8XMX5_ARCLA|nr:hypothetical protein L6452_40381 [Arctium lappa]
MVVDFDSQCWVMQSQREQQQCCVHALLSSYPRFILLFDYSLSKTQSHFLSLNSKLLQIGIMEVDHLLLIF